MVKKKENIILASLAIFAIIMWLISLCNGGVDVFNKTSNQFAQTDTQITREVLINGSKEK